MLQDDLFAARKAQLDGALASSPRSESVFLGSSFYAELLRRGLLSVAAELASAPGAEMDVSHSYSGHTVTETETLGEFEFVVGH